MAKSLIFCPVCQYGVFIENGAIARARKAGLALYCGRECSGIGRRKNRSPAELKEAKRLYDIQYRAERAEEIKAAKAARHKRTYDPEKAAVERRLKMPRHVEYCRRPEYREWKAGYDREYRAKREYGPFWESFMLLQDVKAEALARASRYEIDLQNGKLNKSTKRRREYEKIVGR